MERMLINSPGKQARRNDKNNLLLNLTNYIMVCLLNVAQPWGEMPAAAVLVLVRSDVGVETCRASTTGRCAPSTGPPARRLLRVAAGHSLALYFCAARALKITMLL